MMMMMMSNMSVSETAVTWPTTSQLSLCQSVTLVTWHINLWLDATNKQRWDENCR